MYPNLVLSIEEFMAKKSRKIITAGYGPVRTYAHERLAN